MAHRFQVFNNGRSKWRNEQLMGKSFLDRQSEIVLQIGSDAWTRDELVTRLKCANVNAARILSKAAEQLQVESAKQMAARVSLEDLFTLKGIGITTVYVWLCVLESDAHDPMKWIDRKADNLVTLSTEKLRVKKAQETQKKVARRAARANRHAEAS
jgi:hypothetical protein